VRRNKLEKGIFEIAVRPSHPAKKTFRVSVTVKLHCTSTVGAGRDASKEVCNKGAFATATRGQILLARYLSRLKEAVVDDRRVVTGNGISDWKLFSVAILFWLMLSDRRSVAQIVARLRSRLWIVD
jgi:hypothetical protein